MTTGKFKCFVCNKYKSCNKESYLKKDSGKKTNYTNNIIYDYCCIDCLNKINLTLLNERRFN